MPTKKNNNNEMKNPMEGKKVIFVENPSEPKNADGVCGHLEAVGISDTKRSLYDRFWKREIDIVLSALGLIILSPAFLVLCIAVYVDDPGPIFFSQKRIGLNKKYYKLHNLVSTSRFSIKRGQGAELRHGCNEIAA